MTRKQLEAKCKELFNKSKVQHMERVKTIIRCSMDAVKDEPKDNYGLAKMITASAFRRDAEIWLPFDKAMCDHSRRMDKI